MTVRVATEAETPLITAGLASLLSPFGDRVRLVELADVALSRGEIDIVLYDPANALNDHALIDQLAATDLKTRRVAFAWSQEPAAVRAALASGAAGYIAKSAQPMDIVDALERIHQGHEVRPESPQRSPDGWTGAEAGLSGREAEVLALICQGLSNTEISERAFVSINTVKTYVRSAYRKIDVSTRPQAVIWGMANGFSPSIEQLDPNSTLTSK